MTLGTWLDGYTERDWQTSSDGTVRYALIGLGWWTTDVALPAIASSELATTTTVVSSSKEKVERIASENDIEHALTYEEYHDGMAADGYDAVYVGTPNAYHLEYVETAATLGKAVICEKPMEATIERAERMVSVCTEHDVPLMVAYRMHTDPAVRRARELIENGFLGEPVQVYGNNTQPLLEMIPDPDQWRLNPDITGYGTSVMDLGIYPINTTRFLLDRDPVAIEARMSSHHEAFSDVPDERSSFLLVLEDGVQMTCTASQNAHQDTQLTITGTDGQIELRPAFHGTCELHLSGDGLDAQISNEFGATDEMREEFDYFADRVLTGESIYADGHHGLLDMRIIEAIHRASETDATIEL
ncbi:D-xylose 1-dehydrogenase Gfo6 [Halocatena marina]|uniref:D-xylose 1-dehydrogenase Gfo6 n=1 Tax=Halocatena marina TaxID=2934937 RepID=A0ABD5YI51_9EURY|nr:D-xylose 1-dehydrogenase Gfo6 [Halocatena marina]